MELRGEGVWSGGVREERVVGWRVREAQYALANMLSVECAQLSIWHTTCGHKGMVHAICVMVVGCYS